MLQSSACLVSMVLLVALLLGRAHAQCGSSSGAVGFKGDLTEKEHDVGGSVEVLDDCTFKVESFTYDGDAPASYWWGGKSCSQSDLQDGFPLSGVRLVKAYNGAGFSIKLDGGLSWDEIGCVSVWCEDFNANFGSVSIDQRSTPTPQQPSPSPNPKPSPSPSPTPKEETSPKPSPSPKPEPKPSPSPTITSSPSPKSSPSPAPAGNAPAPKKLMDLPNCQELMPGYYNLWWDIQGEDMYIGLEGLPGPGNKWMGFGFSKADAADVSMVGSDVVVGGIVNGECFANDFFLNIQSQCNWDNGDGVCPDTAGTTTTTPQVDLLECNQFGDMLTLLIKKRLLKQSESGFDVGQDADWNTALDGERFTVWGMGPVSEGSNATRPIVLYHNFQLPGKTASESVHAPKGEAYKINLQQEGNFCGALVMPEAEGAAPPREPPKVLKGVTAIEVTEGTNPNYPNPPAWGISYYLNDMESPVLEVVRGTEYTFTIKSGDQHPMYITDSIVGGGELNSFAGEKVFAGGNESFGTEEQPYALKWTPDASTPNLVYYQCAIHQKLGWEIRVMDQGEESNPMTASEPNPNGMANTTGTEGSSGGPAPEGSTSGGSRAAAGGGGIVGVSGLALVAFFVDMV